MGPDFTMRLSCTVQSMVLFHADFSRHWCCNHMPCHCRPMHAWRRACMHAACLATLLLALGACDAAAELVQLHDDRQLPQGLHAARHLLQGPGGPVQTRPEHTGGPRGGGPGAGASAGNPAARSAALPNPVTAGAAGAVSTPGLSPDGTLPCSLLHAILRPVCKRIRCRPARSRRMLC